MRIGLLLPVVSVACSRTAPPFSVDAQAEVAPPSSASAPARPVPSSLAAAAPPAATGESRHAVLARLSAQPLLLPFLTMLHDHFHGDVGPFATQQIHLAGGRDAWLISRAAGADPIVVAVDRDVLAWSKPRPTAGIVPPALPLAIAPRPDGGVALFAYVASLRILAARMWADDGNAYAEIQLASFEACDTMAAAYGPGLGWIVVCAARFGTRAQRLREDGTTAWGPDGATVGASSPVAAPSIAVDTSSTWVLTQRAKGAAGTDHVLAWRYDADAAPLWASPVDVGALAPSGARRPEDRYDAIALPAGGVRVALPHGLAGKSETTAQIGPAGDVSLAK
jgi:hypothetical protein